MKQVAIFDLFLVVLGCGLLLLGFGLGLYFGAAEVPASGPAGLTVAILFGIGLSFLLLVAVHRTLVHPKTNTDNSLDSEIRGTVTKLRVWRAKLAICYSAIATVLALVLYMVGMQVAFEGFNFATGINDIGFITILTGMVVGVVAIVCCLMTIVLAWIAARTSGNFNWFFAAIAIPILQMMAYLAAMYLLE